MFSPHFVFLLAENQTIPPFVKTLTYKGKGYIITYFTSTTCMRLFMITQNSLKILIPQLTLDLLNQNLSNMFS